MSVQSNETCFICCQTGGDDHVIEGINAYIHDNIGAVHLREIAAQIASVLSENGHQMTQDEVEEHIRGHVQSPKVIMHQKLDELINFSQLAKDSCVCQCAKSGKQLVDVKMVTSYLKTVDRIIAVYRMDCMKA